MIVVIGSPSGRQDGPVVRASGLASLVAMAVAANGRSVQLVGRIGDDAIADAVLQDLTRHGVGHVAILRDSSHATPIDGTEADPARSTQGLDAADVELALRYLIDFSVLVVVDGNEAVLPVIRRAASWAGAAVVQVGATPGPIDGPDAPGGDTADGESRLEATDGETTEAFVARVGATVAGLEGSPGPVRSP